MRSREVKARIHRNQARRIIRWRVERALRLNAQADQDLQAWREALNQAVQTQFVVEAEKLYKNGRFGVRVSDSIPLYRKPHV